MSKAPLQTLEKPIRELLRRRGDPISQEMRLQWRDDDLVRLSLMKAAHERYPEDDRPETVEQWYYPDENLVVMELPEPDGELEGQNTIEDFNDV